MCTKLNIANLGNKKLFRESFTSSNYNVLFTLLHDISDWNGSVRLRAILSLLYYISFTEDAIAPHICQVIDNLLNSLVKSDSSKKSDTSVQYFQSPFLIEYYFSARAFNPCDINSNSDSNFLIEYISRCCSLMGAYLQPSLYLPYLLSLITKNPPSVQNIHHIGSILFILSSFLRGTSVSFSVTNAAGNLSTSEIQSITDTILSSNLIFHNLQEDIFKITTKSNSSKLTPEIHFLFLQIFNVISTVLNLLPILSGHEEDERLHFRTMHTALITTLFRLFISSISTSFHLSSSIGKGSSFVEMVCLFH